MPYPAGKYGLLCKTRSHVAVIVNEGQTNFCTSSFLGSFCVASSEELDNGGFRKLRYCRGNPSNVPVCYVSGGDILEPQFLRCVNKRE